jgi:hypothetical protein
MWVCNTFYQHLSEARGEEQLKIVALKAMSLDAARCYRPTLIFPDFSLFFLTF